MTKQTYTAKQIIDIRKAAWLKHQDPEKDKEFVQQVAVQVMESAELQREIRNNPEYLIEMAFVVVDKDQNTIPFFLNTVQQMFITDLNKAIADYKTGLRRHLKFIVLKGRQQGFTSIITAYQLACSITRKNFAGFTLADEGENTEAIFEDKAKFPYNQLPDLLKPTEKYNNRRELHFEKLNSRWRVATAGNGGVGRSKTLNFFHGSEAGFWNNIKSIMASLGQALTKSSIQILESTANGYNEFKELWDDGNWDCKFYQWWLTPEYTLTFESDYAAMEFKANVNSRPDFIYKRCKWLISDKELNLEQAYWYYNKWLDLRNLVKQEYPCTADEAFLESGACVFDKEIIMHHKEYLKKLYEANPLKRGYFTFKWNNEETKDKILNDTIQFIENEHGFIWLYEPPKWGFPYVIGGDTKGEGSDKFASTCINNVSGKRCCILHGNMEPDIYTHQTYCMGMFFNIALIGIEINFDLYPIKELERLRYPKQYMRQQFDSISNQFIQRYGWKTDGNTRPMIISKEIVLLRDNIDLFPHIPMLDEGLTFVYDKNMRPDAETGKHDDLLISDMIGNEIRPQQKMSAEEHQIQKSPVQLHKDRLAKHLNGGRGTRRLC